MAALESLGLLAAARDFELVYIYPPLRTLPEWDRRMEARLASRTERSQGIGLYVHLPFCTGRCSYCHYLTVRPRSPLEVDAYLDLIEREIELWRRHLGTDRINVRSLHVGGGTPTYLDVGQLARFCVNLSELLSFEADYQWTCEAAPETLTREKARILQEYGVNRLSIGIESLDDRLLESLRRRHNARTALQSLELAQSAGFEEVNADLIYCLPAQTIESWLASLLQVASHRPTSMSLYRLRVRDETPLGRAYRRQAAHFPGVADAVRWRAEARSLLEGIGFLADPVERYQLPQARGNRYQRGTWKDELDYLAIGPSGYWSWAGVVGVNIRDPSDHAAAVGAGELPIAFGKALDDTERAVRMFVPGLKYREGVLVSRALGALEEAERAHIRRALKLMHREGLAESDGDRVVLSSAGELVADEVLTLLYQESYEIKLRAWQNRFGQYA